jgi:hypothetical protein
MTHAILALMIIYFGVGFVGWSLSGSQPGITTNLSAGVIASDTTMPVASITGFPGAGWLYFGGEAMNYSGTTDTCPAPFATEPACFTGVFRGQQGTVAISHANGSRVYNEATGLFNDLSDMESRSSIDQLGDVTSPWAAGGAIVRFLNQNKTWDWPMFEGDFALVRVIGSMITIAGAMGIFYLLANLMISSVGVVSRIFRP